MIRSNRQERDAAGGSNGLMETSACLDGDADLKIVMGIIMTVMGW